VATRSERATPVTAVRRAIVGIKRFWPYFGASRGLLVVLAVGSVIAGLVEAVLLALVAALAGALSQGADSVDTGIGSLALSAPLPTMFAVGIGLALLRGVLQVGLAYVPAKASAAAMASLRRRLFDAFSGTAWSIQAAERDGHFQSLMSTHVTHASQAITTLATGITALLMFVTLLTSAFVLSVPTAVLLLVSSAVLFLLLRPLARRLRSSAQALSAENVEYSKGVQEVVLMAEEMQVFGASTAYRRSIDQLIEQVRAPLLRTRFLARATPGLYQSMAFVLLVLALAIVYALGATTNIAQLGAVVLILIRSLTYGQQIQAASSRMDELVPFVGRLQAALDLYRDNPRQDGDEPLPPVQRIGMQQVHFGYLPGSDVLDDLTFEVHRGEAIGIVGPSGAGKSSLVQLLLRLRDPQRGMLHINGRDARSFRRAEWQQHVSYVPQTPQLIWGTVADNIRFYRPELSDAQVVEAARRAHIHDEITSWPDGYQTVIGQRASAVSGGQRQRLCLARALAGGPDILILDEPTSALDVKSEQLVQQTLEEVKDEMILFLVAHRLSTLSVCDRVMVVVAGRLQAIDEPAELLKRNAFFREVSEITRQQSVS
jgi:ATP-binding cassette subfamily B protein